MRAAANLFSPGNHRDPEGWAGEPAGFIKLPAFPSQGRWACWLILPDFQKIIRSNSELFLSLYHSSSKVIKIAPFVTFLLQLSFYVIPDKARKR